MKSSTLFWLTIAGVAWYLWDQHQKSSMIVGPLQSQGGPAGQDMTMAPCAAGWYQGTDFSGNQTCLPVGSVS